MPKMKTLLKGLALTALYLTAINTIVTRVPALGPIKNGF